MAEKLLVQNDPSSSLITVQRGLGSLYNLANFFSFSRPQRKGSQLKYVVLNDCTRNGLQECAFIELCQPPVIASKRNIGKCVLRTPYSKVATRMIYAMTLVSLLRFTIVQLHLALNHSNKGLVDTCQVQEFVLFVHRNNGLVCFFVHSVA